MVAVDAHGRPVGAVPPLRCETPDEARREREAQVRRANRLAERDQLRDERAHEDLGVGGSRRRTPAAASRCYRPTGWRALKPRDERRFGRQRGPLRPLGSPAALVSRRSPAITAYAWPEFV